MTAVVIAEAVAIALLALLVTGLLRSHGEILRALHELGAGVDPADAPAAGSRASFPLHPAGAGETAHDIAGTALDGSAVAAAVAGTRHDTLLAFLSSGCSTCQPFWEGLREGVDVPGGARVVVVVQSEESMSALRRLAAPQLTVIASSEAWEAYGVPGSPHFVYVHGPSGRVRGEGTAGDWPAVLDLLEHGQSATAADHRDNAARIDAELASVGIGPGHTSLYAAPENPGER